jgi:serine/threonine-protein kinase
MWICPTCRASYDGHERFCARDATPLVDKADFMRIGQTIGKYKLHEILGRGGMGTVYRGEHVFIGKPVAVKVLHERFAKYEEAVKRFMREARAASSIQHPNIADVTDFGTTPLGSVFFVMEYIEGKSLEDVIEEESPLALHRAINIVEQISSALGRAHEKGIVHRDLKPENIMLTKRPGRREVIRAIGPDSKGSQQFVIEPETSWDFVKVLDFGIAKVHEPHRPDASAQSTVAGTIFGTPEYMSPEASRGAPIDHRADIYSLGILFYDMLVGHVPFTGGSAVEILARHIGEAPVPPRKARPSAEITEAAEVLIMRALAKDPGSRQQSMDALREELKGCYGSVAYRRDAKRVRGAAESGVFPRVRRLTEELGELLTPTTGSVPILKAPLPPKEQARIIIEPVTQPPQSAVPKPAEPSSPTVPLDWDSLPAATEDGPILLTKKKPPT